MLGVVAIFSYNLEKATKVFADNDTEYHAISNYDVLKEVALEMSYINEEDITKLNKWKLNPSDETWMG